MSQLQEKSGGGSTVVTEEPVAKSNKRGKKKEQKEQAPVANEGETNVEGETKKKAEDETKKRKVASHTRGVLPMKTHLKRLNVLKGVQTGKEVLETLDNISNLLLTQLVNDAREGVFLLSDNKRISTPNVIAITQQRFTEDMCDEYQAFMKHGLALWNENSEAPLEEVVG